MVKKKMKRCSRCKEWKLLSEFHRDKSRKDNLCCQCKKCKGIYLKKYRQTERGKESNKRACQKQNKKYRVTIRGILICKYHDMKSRCGNLNHSSYKNYGNRGIKCLFKSSQEFVDYAINELKIDPRNLEIDRIDNDGNYEKGNIRFVTHAENNRNRRKKKKMNKRLITKRQEQALRLCHQDFQGLPQIEAAKRMNISQSALGNLLTKAKKILPQYFPLLTKQEAECYYFYMNEGQNVNDIAEHFEVTPDSVYKSLKRARNKGMFFANAKGRVLSYKPSMDTNIKNKF